MDYVYDTLKRLTNKNFTADSTLNVAYSYDLGSRLTSANTAAANNTFTYDKLNRLASSTQALSGAARTLNYTYDKAGNQTQVTYPSGKAVAYTYDPNDRADLVKVNGINIADYNYDVLGRRISRTFLTGNQQQAVYQYDLANQLTSLTNTVLPSTNISTYAYPVYDNVGNRTQLNRTFGADPVQTINYNYNNIYELTSVTGAQSNSYAYDTVANRTTADGVNYTKNTLNQYNTVGGVSYGYDGNGNLTNDGNNVYTYDTENRLGSVINASHTAQYAYDAFNRRVSKTVDGATTYFVYDSDSVVAEYNASGVLQAEYVLGDNIDEVLTMDRGGNTYYYQYDGLGSVTEVTDGTGAVVEHYTYDAYGTPSVTSSLIDNPYMFTGRRWDSESGTYYYRARQYDSSIGRFLQRDPIGYYDSLNLYQYVGNNPGNWRDPYGEEVMGIIGPVGGPTIGPVGGGGGIICPLPQNPVMNSSAADDPVPDDPTPDDPTPEEPNSEKNDADKDKGTNEVPGSRETHTEHDHYPWGDHDHWIEEHTDPKTGKKRRVRRTGPPTNPNPRPRESK